MVSLSESELIEVYNHVPKVLSRKAIKVSVTADSLHKKHHEPIVLEKVKNGNYWLVTAEDGSDCLLPKSNLKINTHEYPTVQSLFQLNGYQPENGSQFTLTKPAKVSLTPSGEKWQLEDVGILDFRNGSLFSQLQSELEQANEAREQVQNQLEKSHEEQFNLMAKLDQLTQEYHKLQIQLEQTEKREEKILSQLVKRQEFQQEMQQARQDRKQLLSLLEQMSQVCSPSSHSQPVETESPKTPVAPNLDPLEKDLVNIYNKEPKRLEGYTTEVSETQDSIRERRLDRSQAAVFEKVRNGTYWILTVQDRKYLVPKGGMKFNQNNYETAQSFFECHGQPNGKFKLLKPAIVSRIDGQDNWQITELGILVFYLESSQ
jgi:Mg2+ and Co2+ transporter CorA